MSTNYHALAVQVVKVNHAEDGPSVRRMALDEQGDADVQDGQASHQYLEYGEVAGNAGVTCVCGSLVRDPLMLKCGHCGVEEHAACYAIVGETYAPAQHCCLRCGNGATEGFVCSDPKLAAKKPECVSNYCTYRRTLVILLTEEFENMQNLVSRLGVEQDYGEHLFNKLCEDGVISSGDGINFMIYQENLEKAMGKRFGGKWEEGAAEKSRGEGNDEVTNTAGAAKDEGQDQEWGRKFVSGGERGQSMPMKEKAAKSGQLGCFSYETLPTLEYAPPMLQLVTYKLCCRKMKFFLEKQIADYCNISNPNSIPNPFPIAIPYFIVISGLLESYILKTCLYSLHR